MKTSLPLLLALLLLSTAALFAGEKSADKSKNCGCGCCKGKDTCCCNTEASADTAKPDTAKRYPLKGVIVDILAERSALLVKHEEIPGYMKAMTMLLKVEETTLKAVKKGQPITGTLVEKADGFWLEDVQPAK